MIIPPPLNTKEREKHDISGLRVLYLVCEDIGIAQQENIQKAFLLLRKLVGTGKFVSEFTILQSFIENKKKEKREIDRKAEREKNNIIFENEIDNDNCIDKEEKLYDLIH